MRRKRPRQSPTDEEIIMGLKKYSSGELSIPQLAKKLGTYPNRIYRTAKAYNIKIKKMSDALKTSYEKGRIKPPTEGRERTPEEKAKIGNTLMKTWSSLTEKERKAISAKNAKTYHNMETKPHEYLKCHDEIRKAAKKGSKMEKAIVKLLEEAGFRPMHHHTVFINETAYHIDIFLPEHNIAIEIDGPSHFEPIYGEEALERTQKKDRKKNSILLSKGMRVIRAGHIRKFSDARARFLAMKIIAISTRIAEGKTNRKLFRCTDDKK